MATLPNGKPIDMDMLEEAMEDSDLANRYYLHTLTGEVLFFSDYDRGFSRGSETEEEIEDIEHLIPIERISSSEAYQWMVDFVDERIFPEDPRLAEKLSNVLIGKGAFRRFKDALSFIDDEWLQMWYQWKDTQLQAAVAEWLEDVL